MRWAGGAARVGGTCLAVALIWSSEAPEMALALLGVGLLVVGGVASSSRVPRGLGVTLLLLAIIGARLTLGTAAAALAALLLGLGAWLRMGPAEAAAGLAAFGAGTVLLGGASVRFVLAFWLLGLGILFCRAAAARVWQRVATGGSLTFERTPPVLSVLRTNAPLLPR